MEELEVISHGSYGTPFKFYVVSRYILPFKSFQMYYGHIFSWLKVFAISLREDKKGGLTKVRTIAKDGDLVATKIFLKIVHYYLSEAYHGS